MPVILYSLSLILLISSFRLRKDDSFFDKHSTNVIKGFFILMIVLLHLLENFSYDGFLSGPLNTIVWKVVGQLVVSMFFFISGYGIIISVQSKPKYGKTILTNRFLRILLYTAVSLIPFIIYTLVSGKYSYSVGRYLSAFIGLKGIGNAHWFIFAILFCYLTCGLTYLFNFKKNIIPTILVTITVVVYIVIACFVIKEHNRWWDTIISFPLGMFAGLFRDKINNLLKNKILSISLMAVSIAVVVVLRLVLEKKLGVPKIATMLFLNIFFCLFFVSLTKIFVLKSPILEYLGKASFAIFIMHKFIIRVFLDYGPIPNEWINYTVIFVLYFAISLPFYYLYKLLDKHVTDKIVKFNRSLV